MHMHLYGHSSQKCNAQATVSLYARDVIYVVRFMILEIAQATAHMSKVLILMNIHAYNLLYLYLFMFTQYDKLMCTYTHTGTHERIYEFALPCINLLVLLFDPCRLSNHMR